MKNQRLPFMLPVQGLSGTDVQGFIGMQRDGRTQTGHGRGPLNAKDGVCNVWHYHKRPGWLCGTYGSDFDDCISERETELKRLFINLLSTKLNTDSTTFTLIMEAVFSWHELHNV